jgi:CheY-like chemotaxis protein
MSAETVPMVILLVEDNEDDIFLMTRIFQKEKIAASLQVVTDGRQAVHYLEGKGGFSDRIRYPIPNLVFLDLKLPYLNGFEVLARVRQIPDLRSLPVVILSSSLEDKDRATAQSFGVPYFVKPPTASMVFRAIGLPAS